MIRLDAVVAGYGAGGDVLQGVTLDVPKAAITCIVGPNGAGKSTVLKTISGLLAPRSGSIHLGDRQLDGLAPQHIIAHGVVQVPQQGGLFQPLTVHENMLLGGHVIRKDKRRLARRIDELSEIFPLVRERKDELASNLSGGQRRIVEFARALILEPKVVLLDEPTIGLDPLATATVFKSTQLMCELGTTVLMVEQNVRFGLSLASTGVVMERGTVLMTGPADALLARPDMAAMFFGASPQETPSPLLEPVSTAAATEK